MSWIAQLEIATVDGSGTNASYGKWICAIGDGDGNGATDLPPISQCPAQPPANLKKRGCD
jgi:hypothetical protein